MTVSGPATPAAAAAAVPAARSAQDVGCASHAVAGSLSRRAPEHRHGRFSGACQRLTALDDVAVRRSAQPPTQPPRWQQWCLSGRAFAAPWPLPAAPTGWRQAAARAGQARARPAIRLAGRTAARRGRRPAGRRVRARLTRKSRGRRPRPGGLRRTGQSEGSGGGCVSCLCLIPVSNIRGGDAADCRPPLPRISGTADDRYDLGAGYIKPQRNVV